MKGSRAKKAAEEAARAEAAAREAAEPTPPDKPREGPAAPRPQPGGANGKAVQIPEEEFKKICQKIRTNVLMGAAAADALEAAAGISEEKEEASGKATALRSEVAESREEPPEPPKKEKKKGGAMMFACDEPDEIPEVEYADDDDEDETFDKQKREVPELNLTPKQNSLRTDIEMWLMDEIPVLFGVDDSEELADDLQEDGQADMATFLIAESDEAGQQKLLEDWLKDAPDPDAKDDFMAQLISKVQKIQELGPKKKKKKKG